MNIINEMRELATEINAECELLAAERGCERKVWPKPIVIMGGPMTPIVGWRGRNGDEYEALEKQIARLTFERNLLRSHKRT